MYLCLLIEHTGHILLLISKIHYWAILLLSKKIFKLFYFERIVLNKFSPHNHLSNGKFSFMIPHYSKRVATDVYIDTVMCDLTAAL